MRDVTEWLPLASFALVVLVWCCTPVCKRYVTLELRDHGPNPAWSFTLLNTTLCTIFAWVAQSVSREGVVRGWVMLSPRALLVTAASATLTTLCGFVLTWLLSRHNPGHVMAGLNSITVFLSFVLGSVLYGTLTANGCTGASLMGIGAYLVLEDKAKQAQ